MSDACYFTLMLNRGSRRLGVVLMPYLGRARAHHRGSVIAQTLLEGRGDPVSVATSLLPELTGITQRNAAAHVARAWLSLNAAH